MMTTLMLRRPALALATRAISLSPATRTQEFNKDGMPKDTETVKHFIAHKQGYDKHSQDYLMPHPIWSKEEAENVQITHEKYIGIAVRYSAMLHIHIHRLIIT